MHPCHVHLWKVLSKFFETKGTNFLEIQVFLPCFLPSCVVCNKALRGASFSSCSFQIPEEKGYKIFQECCQIRINIHVNPGSDFLQGHCCCPTAGRRRKPSNYKINRLTCQSGPSNPSLSRPLCACMCANAETKGLSLRNATDGLSLGDRMVQVMFFTQKSAAIAHERRKKKMGAEQICWSCHTEQHQAHVWDVAHPTNSGGGGEPRGSQESYIP